jgi:hypothetical protein
VFKPLVKQDTGSGGKIGRERGRQENVTEELVKRESHGRSERHFILRGRKSIILSEGSQASPSRLSDKGRMKVKWLGWLEAVACDKGRGVLIF